MESFRQCEHLFVSGNSMKTKIIIISSDSTNKKNTDALNETNPGMHITEDAILQIELGFKKMRELFQCKYTRYSYHKKSI